MITDSNFSVFKSHFFSSAISSRSFLVSFFPSLFLLGSQEPFFSPSFHRIRFDVTGFQISI